MNYGLRKIFPLTIFLVGYLLSFLFISPARAADVTNCCLNENVSPQTCRVETLGQPCDETIYKFDTAKSGGVCDPERGKTQGCVSTEVIGKQKEQRVSCSSRQVCIEATRAQTKCNIFPERNLCLNNPNCFWFGECYNRNDSGVCGNITQKEYCGPDATGRTQGSEVCKWNDAQGRCITRVEEEVSSQYARTGGILPPCAYEGNCRSLNDLVSLFISIAREAFKYIGSIAFLFFIYGGLTIVLSFGNADKVKKGRDILVAAVIGIIISFGAYMLISFLMDVLRVTAERGVTL